MANTNTTLVNPNYSYTGQAPRQVRPDQDFIAPTLQLGGKRTAAPVSGDQTQYGRPGQGGEQMFFTREAPDPLMYAAPQKPMPVSPDLAGSAGLGDQMPDPRYSGQNPGGPRTPVSGGPAARPPNPGVYQSQPTQMFQPTVDQAVSKRPTAMGTTQQSVDQPGWASALGGIAQLGGAIKGSVDGSNQAFDAAVAGKGGGAPAADGGGWRGKMSDAVNGLMGGHDRKSIQYARDAGGALKATAPSQINFGSAPDLSGYGDAANQNPGPQGGLEGSATSHIQSMFTNAQPTAALQGVGYDPRMENDPEQRAGQPGVVDPYVGPTEDQYRGGVPRVADNIDSMWRKPGRQRLYQ